MLKVISSTFALLVAYTTWSLAAILSGGFYPLGGGLSWPEGLVFFAPIIVLILPVAARLFSSGSSAAGIWLIAIGPIVGVLNLLLCAFVVLVCRAIFGRPHISATVAYLLSFGLWVLIYHFQRSGRNVGVKVKKSAQPIRVWRRPERR